MGETGERKLISIVVPVYNEEGNIVPLYEAVNAVFAPIADRYDHEFVFTDNRSQDGTFAELSALAARDARVRVFRFSRNFGFQRSIYTGYVKARGHAAVQIDCDLQDPPSLIVEFIRAWEEGNIIVYGVRRARREGWLITWIRKVFYRLIDLLSEDRLPLDAGDFRLVDRKVIGVLRRISDDKPYLRGTLATLGFQQKGIPYDRAGRVRGESKFSLRDLFGLALDGILAHSTVPLRVATYTGLAVSVITLLGVIGYIVGRILFGANWPIGFATTTVLILLSLSLNALFLGIIGEYVGRIYQQVRRRPLTIIDQSIERSDPGADVEHHVTPVRERDGVISQLPLPIAPDHHVIDTVARAK
ncbi:glycosyltransferase family 2 protein [Chondromyces crocatus]|uniref:Glycosyltransferase n=1 Tax=Chondromyces crocatus TaxID=52 RepID=A0A0K1E8Y9_CHOCO|nr:glycosyltransferase family 2 protein [Chondromyces crocatus]AKT37132.1 glycosyltransferase [Chondromyces crocatus]